ncbi:MAG TPA: hypothetical protein VF729_08360 [Solirubrobacterales bacterium]
MERATPSKANGPAVAVTIAAGIGALVLGIFTLLSEASEGVHEFLEFSERVGPLSGKTVFGAGAFLLSWGGLHVALRDREVDWRPAIGVFLVLLAAALVLTFPPFFQIFKSE